MVLLPSFPTSCVRARPAAYLSTAPSRLSPSTAPQATLPMPCAKPDAYTANVKALNVQLAWPIRKFASKQRIRTSAQPRICQRRQFATHALEVFHVERRAHHALLIGCAGEHSPPRVDDHRIAVVAESMNVGAELRWRHHIALIFDRTSADQRVPMGLAGRKRKRARDRKDSCAREREPPVKLRKAQVVAHAETDRAKLGRCRHDLGARDLRVGLFDRNASRQVNVEQMDLAIHGELLAVRAKQHGGVVAPGLARRILRNRAGENMNLVFTRQSRQLNTSGNPTSLAPRAAASRIMRSAFSRLAALSRPVDI